MDRSKKVVFLSHCILNQNTVVHPLARAKGAYRQIIESIMEAGIGIHQMPCPEYKYLGLTRKPMTKEEYDTTDFRVICKEISHEIIKDMLEYKNNDYEIIGIIGINESPTCSIKGNNKGIFMEELFNLYNKSFCNNKAIDVSIEYSDSKDNVNEIEQLKKFLLNE